MKESIVKDYRLFLSTLKEVSYDKEHKTSLVLDDSKEHRVYNFDGITKKFAGKLQIEIKASCDAYYEKNDDSKYLIEFKNQKEGNIDKQWIRNKIYNSVTTLAMNQDITRGEVADNTTVIVVYNDEQISEKTEFSYNTSDSFNKFAQKMAFLSSKTGIDRYEKKFDLEKYRGVLFKEVYTIDKNIFNSEFIDELFSVNE